MKAHITKANAVDDVRPVLAHVSASAPSWMLHGVISQLIDFTATSEDYVPLFEF